MSTNEWTIKAQLSGNFRIRQPPSMVENANSGVKNLRVVPDVDEKGQPKGTYTIDFEAEVPPQVGNHQDAGVVDFAKASVDHIAAMLSLATGSRVDVVCVLNVIQYNSADPKMCKALVPSQVVPLVPPVEIDAAVTGLALEPSVQRAVWWYAQALRAHDPSDGFMALLVSLDLLAATVNAPGSRSRKCDVCGSQKRLDPGLREKVVHFLKAEGGLGNDVAEDIYAARIDLMHGRVKVDERLRRRLRAHSKPLRAAIRRGVAKRANYPNFASVLEDPFDPHSAFLTLTIDTSAKPASPEPQHV